MATLMEELIRSIELWLRASKKAAPLVNPNLDPVILVPGIAGSILNAVDDDGKEERIWVRILRADHEFRSKLWSRFDPKTGKTVSMDEKSRIVVPEDRYGLYAIDVLDPDLVIGQESVYYYHDLIEQMIRWGYQEGKTLFGFGYDFRQSNRLQETLDRFLTKLESVYTSSGGKKINLITHSMGGLLVKCFMCLHSDIFEKYVKNWITIATPFQGAPGYITAALLNGCSFVDGWEQNFFISKWSMQQLLIECPSIYELMASPNFSWENIPVLQIWRGKHGDGNNICTLLESYSLTEMLPLMKEALSGNTVEVDGKTIHLPLNLEILKWANETREILSRAKLPANVKFYNVYGTHYETPHSVCYGTEHTPISDLKQLLPAHPKYIYVNGDGTVPVESAKADGLDAVARVGVAADHRGIVCDRHVFRVLKHWLNAGEPDPFYDPLNDYVILPTAFEIEKHCDKGLQVTTLKEEWEVVSPDTDAMVGVVSVTSVGKEQPLASAQASIAVQPRSEGVQHVEVRASGITMGA
ncbi:lecithin-cholesterol acyltransferase-like 4 [Iris pallida]|uniref:Lecithin-cholesterol acyltransferase-like 4 n=1 Tax=Iris pallida TaxID=29817 RepID=A0AAX6DNI4_IRIPA|nr:lecithin-cholesterol acyltransferase-like 4 [Iris pallida]